MSSNQAHDRAYSALLDIPIQDYSICLDKNGIEIIPTENEK